MASERLERIRELIEVIPEGFVATYGDLCPEAPRLTGCVVKRANEGTPWHRVVCADGSWTQGERQRRLLEEEGIPLVGGRVDLELARIPREALLDRLEEVGARA